MYSVFDGYMIAIALSSSCGRYDWHECPDPHIRGGSMLHKAILLLAVLATLSSCGTIMEGKSGITPTIQPSEGPNTHAASPLAVSEQWRPEYIETAANADYLDQGESSLRSSSTTGSRRGVTGTTSLTRSSNSSASPLGRIHNTDTCA